MGLAFNAPKMTNFAFKDVPIGFLNNFMEKEDLIEYWDNGGTESRLLSHDEADLSLPVTAVICYAVKNNSILLIKNYRGWDIPGGHIEPGEIPLDAVKRELKEEANCVADDFFVIGYLHCRQIVANPKYPQESLLVIYSCYDFEVDHGARLMFETSEVKFVSLDEVGNHHFNWTDVKRKLLENAVNFKLTCK
jgi:8-oxo-dGTP pyrophosphatase MutT (NUDIX family)